MSDTPRDDDGRRDEWNSGTERNNTERDEPRGEPGREGRTHTETSREGGSTQPRADTSREAQMTGEPGREDRSMTDTDRSNRSGMGRDTLKLLSGVVALIGLWIAASPFMYETTQTALWNNLAIGGAIFLLAAYNFYRMSNHEPANVGSSSLIVLLGLWSIVAPFLLDFGSEALVYSTMASGLAAALLSGYNAYESRRTETTQTTGTRA